jgi:hypothetical protein
MMICVVIVIYRYKRYISLYFPFFYTPHDMTDTLAFYQMTHDGYDTFNRPELLHIPLTPV